MPEDPRIILVLLGVALTIYAVGAVRKPVSTAAHKTKHAIVRVVTLGKK